MANTKKIAFLTAAELISPATGTVQPFEHLDKAQTREVEVIAKVAEVPGAG